MAEGYLSATAAHSSSERDMSASRTDTLRKPTSYRRSSILRRSSGFPFLETPFPLYTYTAGMKLSETS